MGRIRAGTGVRRTVLPAVLLTAVLAGGGLRGRRDADDVQHEAADHGTGDRRPLPRRRPAAATTAPAPPTTPPGAGGATLAPAWLGTRVLPTDAQGYGVAGGTPPELRERRIVTVDLLSPPADGRFHATRRAGAGGRRRAVDVGAGLPGGLADLRYVTVTFRGFDGRAHTGELHRAPRRWPPTSSPCSAGCSRRTTRSSGCASRRSRSATPPRPGTATPPAPSPAARRWRRRRWSEHAYGRADRRQPVPEPLRQGPPRGARAGRRLHAARPRPARHDHRRRAGRGRVPRGRLGAGAASWRSSKDYMHFSVNGR